MAIFIYKLVNELSILQNYKFSIEIRKRSILIRFCLFYIEISKSDIHFFIEKYEKKCLIL